jgi:ABC-type phosphate/phosphonate transport system substrate-binding protein
MGGKFCDTILTGSHIASVAAVAEGRADFAAIDCVVHANLVRYRPQALAGTRILCSTPGMPGLPLIAGRAVSSGHLRAMKEGLANAAADSGLAEVRRALGIRGVSFTTPADYGRMQLALRKADNAGVEPLA